MKLSKLHMEAETKDNPGSEKDEGTPAHRAIQDAGGIKEVRKKLDLSPAMMSHLRKPPGDEDHRNPSAKTLAKAKAAGVDINKLLPKVEK